MWGQRPRAFSRSLLQLKVVSMDEDEVVNRLVRQLSDAEEEVRFNAYKQLAALGPRAAFTMPEWLLAISKENDPWAVIDKQLFYVDLGPEALNAMIDGLKNASTMVQKL